MLIVDDVAANVRLLETLLTAEYFEVVAASSGEQALAICRQDDVDLVLLDVLMPGMDGFETCARLKADPRTQHIPVLMITALNQISERVRGLEAGADDFLSKPVDDVELLARVKSLTRLKAMTDELVARADSGEGPLATAEVALEGGVDAEPGRVLVIDTDRRRGTRMRTYLKQHHVDVLTNPAEAVFLVAGGNFDVALVAMELDEFDPLRVCSQIRTLEQGRQLPLILMAEEADRARVIRGLDLGVNDFITRPVDRNELLARVRTQVRRHRYALELRESMAATMTLAVTDDLTGLYNRRYFDRHLGMLLGKARAQQRDLAVMLIDVDYFKVINDTHGHDAGDATLREFAQRLKRNIRGVDLPCRYGGEEFAVLMPDTDLGQAQNVAEHVRAAMGERPFETVAGRGLTLTVSIGLAVNEMAADTPDGFLKRADIALYRAKREGRNRVVFDAA